MCERLPSSKSCWFRLNTIVQSYNADRNSNDIGAQWPEANGQWSALRSRSGAEVEPQSSAALRGSMALSRFLCCVWSNSLVQPTSLYSSVNSGKKAGISFLPPSLGPRRVYEKPSSEAKAQHQVPSVALRAIVSSVYVSKACRLSKKRKKNNSASWTLSEGTNIA